MKIFISHSSREKPLIRAIVPELPPYIGQWLDEEQLFFGEDVEASLKTAIQDDSDFVILFVSHNAVDSPWVQRELKWALAREKEVGTPFVLPIVLDKDAWDRIKPAVFRKRRFLTCADFSEAGTRALAGQLQSELMGWIVRHFDQRRMKAQKAPISVSLAGRWTSTFTWDPRHEGDPGESADTIMVTQTGDEVSGETLEGDYAYKFRGRIVGEYLLGEWQSLKLPLFGVFQLKLEIDSLQSIEGYWIGNGARLPYHGKWIWHRDNLKPTASHKVRPRRKPATPKKNPGNPTARKPTTAIVRRRGVRKK